MRKISDLSVILVVLLSFLILSCGGGGGGGGSTTTTGFDSSMCPTTQDSFEEMNPATYAVAIKVRLGPDDVRYIVFGTAFAIRDHLMATNAHITEAFKEFQGIQIEEAVAVQSGTGRVVQLLRAITHPDYKKSPLSSPDVGLLTTQEVLTDTLVLASDIILENIRLGDEILITGFPGDVDNFIPVVPTLTVPQATSLSGRVSALRSYRLDVEVTPENMDMIQHQAPTTPGTSGSAMLFCGEVVGANNAGTVQITVTVGADGELASQRTAAAANNFAVNVKYVKEMVNLFDAQALQGFELPPPFVPVPQDPGNPGTPGDPADPGDPGDPGDPADPGEPQIPVVNEVEPNDTLGQVQVVTPPIQINAAAKQGDTGINIGTAENPIIAEDVFGVSLSTATRMGLLLSTNNVADFDMYIFNANRELVTRSDNYGNGNEQIVEDFPAGDYYIIVDAWENTSDVSYGLLILTQ